jgi:hypothetical protein
MSILRKENKQYDKKSVSFINGIKETSPPDKCRTCGHRNVPPRIITLFFCKKCGDNTCGQCISSGNYCFNCEYAALKSKCNY